MADATTLVRRLDPGLRGALERAAQRCVAATHASVELEHLLLALLDGADAPLARALEHGEIDAAAVRRDLERALEALPRGNGRTPLLASGLLEVLAKAWEVASLGQERERIAPSALLRALVDEPGPRRLLVAASPVLARLRADAVEADGDAPLAAAPPADATSAGADYVDDLTARAARGDLDPVVGRDGEIRLVVDVLLRRRQNNPILIGDAGVGKTAVVEGLAQRVAEGAVPQKLREVRLLALDVGALQAGAGVRGEFERRLKDVLAEATGGPRPALLFVDEAHMLIGLGGKEGQGDAANLLKPALARGELRLIAATTWGEYKRYIEKDPALARRLQVIRVDEPADAAAVDMLRALRPTLERHHGVRIADEAVTDAVRLSRRYISGRQLPDKAIGVLDTAASRTAIAAGAPPAPLDARRAEAAARARELEAGREAAALGGDGDGLEQLEEVLAHEVGAAERLESHWLEQRETVARLREAEARVVAGERDAAEAADELRSLRLQLEVLHEQAGRLVAVEVDARAVAEVVADWTGIPAGRVLADSATAAATLFERLRARVVGQDQALDALCRRIRTYHAQLGEPARPAGVFLLTGPSGVGKTETALALADLFFGGPHALVTINLSEYQEAHTVSQLRGAPPGYVGYGKGGVLTEAVRRRPYSVVLLDEVEKAHRDVLELFFQVFDRGMLEDSDGQLIDFSNTLILLTSNVAAERIADAPADAALDALIRPELRRRFPDALLGRLVVVPFRALGDTELAAIARLKLARVQERFQTVHDVELTYDTAVVDALVRHVGFAETGARAIEARLTHDLLPELAGVVLERLAAGEPLEACHLSVAPSGAFALEVRP